MHKPSFGNGQFLTILRVSTTLKRPRELVGLYQTVMNAICCGCCLNELDFFHTLLCAVFKFLVHSMARACIHLPVKRLRSV